MRPDESLARRQGSLGAYVRITTNFIHDMSTGTWAACVLVIWVLWSRSSGVPAEAAEVLSAASLAVFWLLLASLAGIAVTGGLRLRYWRSETPPHLVAAKRSALLVKHVVFLVGYGGGTLWAWSMLGP